jgi:predicted amidohydrolase
MRIGYVQNDPVYGEREENLRALESALAGAERADLWVVPELFATGYLFGSRAEAERLAEPVDGGPTVRTLVGLARGTGAAFVAGLAERAADGRIFNAAVAVDGQGLRAVYRKIHLFDREKEWFDPGDLGFPVVTLAGARVGLMICFDWRFPEAARSLALAGAQIIAHPSNLVMAFCQAAMVTRALENRVFTVTANRIGAEDRAGSRLTFTGGSRIVAPSGRVLSDAPAGAPASACVEIDPTEADDKRATAQNDLLSDRRPEFYRLGGPAAPERAR